jgi:vanillate O-demethylase monooxygenase subunit
MHNTQPGPFHVRQGGFKGEVDRWQIIDFKPGIVVIDSGMTDAGKGGPFNLQEDTFNLHKVLYNGITPETEHTAHYFWSMAHASGADRPAYAENLYQEVVETFDEDIQIIESQYARMRSVPEGRASFNRIADVGGVQARKILEQMIAREQAGDEIRVVSSL